MFSQQLKHYQEVYNHLRSHEGVPIFTATYKPFRPAREVGTKALKNPKNPQFVILVTMTKKASIYVVSNSTLMLHQVKLPYFVLDILRRTHKTNQKCAYNL